MLRVGSFFICLQADGIETNFITSHSIFDVYEFCLLLVYISFTKFAEKHIDDTGLRSVELSGRMLDSRPRVQASLCCDLEQDTLI